MIKIFSHPCVLLIEIILFSTHSTTTTRKATAAKKVPKRTKRTKRNTPRKVPTTVEMKMRRRLRNT